MKQFLFAFFATFIISATAANAERWNVDNGGIFSEGTKAVIEGYDPVAYYTENKAVKGNPELSATYEGATFWFASPDNKARFEASPASYAPQYGGYCAFAAAHDDLVEVDPTAWKIVDGKLYLNYSQSVQEEWETDISGYITKADANWPELQQQ